MTQEVLKMLIRRFSPKSYRAVFKWGAPDVFYTIEERLKDFMGEKLGLSRMDMENPYLPGLDEIQNVPGPSLKPQHIEKLGEIVGSQNVYVDDFSRVKHSCGSTFLDLMNLRLKNPTGLPDAVVAPRDEKDCRELVDFCNKMKIPLVPSGARSSVTLGLKATRGGVCLDMTKHMNKVLEVNPEDLSARVQPGIYGPAYENHLNALGYTCGHFPQSFEYSTVGGWVATRGAGQQSTYYGKAEDLVLALRCVTPAGTIATRPFPRAALGPDLNSIIVGSEGSYGIITESTLKIFRQSPMGRLPICFMFKSFEGGLTALRKIMQAGYVKPGVFRLSDPEETEVALELDGLSGGPIDKVLKGLGYKPGGRSLFISATEGEPRTAVHTMARAHATAIRHGGLPLGPVPLKSWEKRRFHDPYLRDDLMDMGVITDTLETAVTWSGIKDLWKGVRSTIKKRPHTVAMTHISHAYENGANLYFIFLSPMKRGNEIEDYKSFHKEIIDAVIKHGGSLSHHHGIGKLFAPWYEEHLGKTGHHVLKAIKEALDPNCIMNPGTLNM